MASNKIPVIRYRRKRSGRTDYKKRLNLLRSRQPRFVVRKSNTKLIAQIIQYAPTGDKVIITMDTSKLKKDYGWNYSLKNIPAAYLLGAMIGKQASTKKITQAIVDLGRQPAIKGSKLSAVIKGAIDAGLKVPAGEIFPKNERLQGQHITGWLKDNKDIVNLPKKFEEIKGKVLK